MKLYRVDSQRLVDADWKPSSIAYIINDVLGGVAVAFVPDANVHLPINGDGSVDIPDEVAALGRLLVGQAGI